MSDTNYITDLISYLEEFCKNNEFTYSINEKSESIRFDISHQKDHVNVDIYHTGSFRIQGAESPLKVKLQEFKSKTIQPSNIQNVSGSNRASISSYLVKSEEIRRKIKDSISNLGDSQNILANPSPKEEYRIMIIKGNQRTTITQYHSGSLVIQGKYDSLYDECCESIEKIGNPDQREVIIRFISQDEQKMKEFASIITPALEENGLVQAKAKLGGAFEYLNDYDQKYFIASKCLEISKLYLPEYSAYVMPAAKGFEGFIKKLLEDIGFKQKGSFQQKGADFKPLGNEGDTEYRSFIAKNPDRHLAGMMRRVHTSLNHYRNFMMHSDGGIITTVNTVQDAEAKISRIMLETKELFEYFNGVFKIYP